MVKIKVDLKERSYDIHVGTQILADLGKVVDKKEVFVVTDPQVNSLYGSTVKKSLKNAKVHVLEIPQGERYKNLKSINKLYDQLVKYSAHRDALVVALGGGVIGDMAGFLAATYMRGIDFIQVPTTLLAQVDAAIGGKTGVNHPKGKNLIGSFYQPKLVYIDIQTLSTLPLREIRTGLAEVVKYGIIKDADFFKFLEANAHHLNINAFKAEDTKRAALKVWQTIVAESVKIKAKVVERDEKEAGLRMILNFGHSVGHTIETLTQYKSYNHGEAVSIGMVAAARIAYHLKELSKEAVERIEGLLKKLGLPITVSAIPCKKVIKVLGIDKKVRDGKLTFVIPEKIGKVKMSQDIPAKVVNQVLAEIGCV